MLLLVSVRFRVDAFKSNCVMVRIFLRFYSPETIYGEVSCWSCLLHRYTEVIGTYRMELVPSAVHNPPTYTVLALCSTGEGTKMDLEWSLNQGYLHSKKCKS